MDWKALVKKVAPVIGTALGSPIAGMALKFLGDKFLGNENATEQDIASYILSASPDTLLKLKQSDNEFAAKMAQVGVDLEKIAADDRASARNRQIAMHDWTPNILAFIFLVGYFLIQWHFANTPLTQGQEILSARIQDAMMLILAFFFGSSASSRAKDHVLIQNKIS